MEQVGLIESASKVAMDESGLIGQVSGEALGCCNRLKEGVVKEVRVYLMEVEGTVTAWLDRRLRQCRGLSLEEVRRLLVKPGFQDMLGRAIMRIGDCLRVAK
jgi:hypothetical protein